MKKILSFTAVALLATVGTANAATIVTDVTGMASNEFQADALNETFGLDIGAGSTFTGVGWDVVITTVGASWLDEANISVLDSGGTVLETFQVASALTGDGSGSGLDPDDGGGTGGNLPLPFASVGIIANTGGPVVIADGLLTIELHELGFNDNIGTVDTLYDSGTITVEFSPVPEPGSLALLGLGGLALLRRRR